MFKPQLSAKLKNATNVVVLGVGSDLRGDDAAGVMVAQKLQTLANPKITAIIGGTAPENFTGQIKTLAPSHLIIIDTAEMKETPGTIKVIETADIGGYSFSTHALPMSVMVGYLLEQMTCEVIMIGIQPKCLAFGAEVSIEVKAAVENLYQFLLTI